MYKENNGIGISYKPRQKQVKHEKFEGNEFNMLNNRIRMVNFEFCSDL